MNAFAAIREGYTQTGHGFDILLQTLIEDLLFSLQPVFEGMAVVHATLFIQGVGTLRDARMDVLGLSIRPVSTGVLVVPRWGRISSDTLRGS
jgi:hypothetical protein